MDFSSDEETSCDLFDNIELFGAIRSGQYDEVKKILKSYDTSLYSLNDKKYCSEVYDLIAAAVDHKYPLIVKLILKKFPKSCFQMESGLRSKLIVKVITSGDCETLKFLLEKGTGTKANYSKFIKTQPTATAGFSALHTAAKKGHLELVKLLLSKGAHVNARNSNHKTPLHVARGHSSVVQYLVRKGGKLNCKDDQGQMPLHCAASSKSVESVKILLENGADFTIQDKWGRTVLHHAAKGAPEVLQYFINLNLFDINVQSTSGCTPLHIAVEHSFGNTQVLLTNGSELNVRDNQGRTPLFNAISRGLDNVIKYLLSRGADMTCKDNKGKGIAWMIFGIPSYLNNTRLFPVLLNHGFNINWLLEEGAETVESWLDKGTTDVSCIIQEIALSVALNEYVDGKFFELITKTEKFSRFYETCEKELKKMMAEKLGETNISLFDICTRDSEQLMRYFRNSEVAKTSFSYDAHREKFPNYFFNIHNQGLLGRETVQTMEKCKNTCYFAFSRLPVNCFEKVLGFLSKFDMLHLIEACKSKK